MGGVHEPDRRSQEAKGTRRLRVQTRKIRGGSGLSSPEVPVDLPLHTGSDDSRGPSQDKHGGNAERDHVPVALVRASTDLAQRQGQDPQAEDQSEDAYDHNAPQSHLAIPRRLKGPSWPPERSKHGHHSKRAGWLPRPRPSGISGFVLWLVGRRIHPAAGFPVRRWGAGELSRPTNQTTALVPTTNDRTSTHHGFLKASSGGAQTMAPRRRDQKGAPLGVTSDPLLGSDSGSRSIHHFGQLATDPRHSLRQGRRIATAQRLFGWGGERGNRAESAGFGNRLGEPAHEESDQPARLDGRQVERLDAPVVAPQAQIHEPAIETPGRPQANVSFIDREVPTVHRPLGGCACIHTLSVAPMPSVD